MTYEELQALRQQQQATIDLLSKQVQELTETVRVLKELLNRNSNNSSSPPSANRENKDKSNKLLRSFLQSVCHERGLWKVGQLSWEAFSEKAQTMKVAFREILCIGRKSAFYRKTKRLCDRLLKEFDRMWVFLQDQRVELTNNESERNLRPIVLKRKVSLESWGASGEAFIAKAYSIMATLAKRGFSFAHYVRDVFRSVMSGLEVPPLPG